MWFKCKIISLLFNPALINQAGVSNQNCLDFCFKCNWITKALIFSIAAHVCFSVCVSFCDNVFLGNNVREVIGECRLSFVSPLSGYI